MGKPLYKRPKKLSEATEVQLSTSKLQRILNRTKKHCEKYRQSGILKKVELTNYYRLISKLKREGRITTEELSEFIISKEKIRENLITSSKPLTHLEDCPINCGCDCHMMIGGDSKPCYSCSNNPDNAHQDEDSLELSDEAKEGIMRGIKNVAEGKTTSIEKIIERISERRKGLVCGKFYWNKEIRKDKKIRCQWNHPCLECSQNQSKASEVDNG